MRQSHHANHVLFAMHGDPVPVEFDISEEDLYPVIEENALNLWSLRMLEGEDLKKYRAMCHQHCSYNPADMEEEEDEWPIGIIRRKT